MAQKDISSMRGVIEFLKEEKELLTVKGEVDPIYEISGILKSFEGGPALLFENIKGFPNTRTVGNIYSKTERMATLFDVDNPQKLTSKCVEAIRNPIPPKVVEEAPCQEVVITKEIDVLTTLPLLKHAGKDPGRVLGGGNTLLCGKYFDGGKHLSFNRLYFRGKDFSSFDTRPPTHTGSVAFVKYPDERIPLTSNICTPPAVAMVAGAGGIHSVRPSGIDELGIVGGLQGYPVEICKAKTVDAYSIANAEWVLEGYLEPETTWESEEAEKLGESGVIPFFPEWPGYLGRATKTRKFQVTAITHRRDRPILFTPLAYSFEGTFVMTVVREAYFYELAERVYPGLVVDVNIMPGLTNMGGVIFQIRKTELSEGFQRNLLIAALGASSGLRLAIAVDEDVDIYSAEDILWAITTRVNPNTDILHGPQGGRGIGMMPTERIAKGGFEGGMGIDATAPLSARELFERGKYPVDKVELSRWFSEEEITAARAMQNEYARVLAQMKNW